MTEVEKEVKLNGDDALTGAAEATGGTEVTVEPANKDGEAVIDEGKKDEVEETEEKETEKPVSTEKKGRGRRGAASPGSVPAPVSDRPHRERKVTERFAVEDIRDKNADVDVKQGKGMQLKDISGVAAKMSKKNAKNDDIVALLHSLLYNKRGKAAALKKNILEFSGFVWANAEKERSKLKEKLGRYTKEGLSQLMTLLDLATPKGAKKGDHIDAVVDFLEDPQGETEENGEKTPTKKRKSLSKGSARKKAVEADEEEEEEEEDEEEEEEAPKKRGRRSATKKGSAKKVTADKEEIEAEAETKPKADDTKMEVEGAEEKEDVKEAGVDKEEEKGTEEAEEKTEEEGGEVVDSEVEEAVDDKAQPEAKEVEGKEDAEETAETAETAETVEEAVPLAKETAEIEEKAEAEK